MVVGLVGGGYGLLALFNSLGFVNLWGCLIRWALSISGGSLFGLGLWSFMYNSGWTWSDFSIYFITAHN